MRAGRPANKQGGHGRERACTRSRARSPCRSRASTDASEAEHDERGVLPAVLQGGPIPTLRSAEKAAKSREAAKRTRAAAERAAAMRTSGRGQ